MNMVNGGGKRLLSIFLVLVMVFGAADFTGLYAQAAETAAETQREPVVITLNAMGGTIPSAVQQKEPDSSAWCQTQTGIYKRVLNSYQKLPNAVAPCYSSEVEFDGWYDSMDYKNRVEDVFVESGSQTLYAKWTYRNISAQNENMWFRHVNSMVDVRGWDGQQTVRTTYNDGGYNYYCKVGTPANTEEPSYENYKLNLPNQAGDSIFYKHLNYDIYIASLVTLDGTYATLHYIVVNTGSEDIENVSLAYAADIMIGSDDRAYVTTIQDERLSSTYIQMEERTAEDGKVFRLYVQGTSYGITDVDGLWVGLWESGTFRKNIFNTENNMTSTAGGDSAFTCSWVNRTIPAGSSEIFSVKLGVGELSEMGDSSNTVTLDANGGVFRDGSEISSHSGNSIPVGSLETPTRIGYEFDGWYSAREGGTRQTSNITESITLYAHWKEALYDLINDTVVQSMANEAVPKEVADITVQYGDIKVGREQSAEEVIQTGQQLSLSLGVTEGFYLPKSIYVDIKGVEGTVHLTEGTGYRYVLNEDKTKAQITVLPEYLTGDVVITTIGHPVPAELPESVEAVIEGGGQSVEISLTDDLPVLEAIVEPEQLQEHTYHYQWYENSEASNQNGGRIPGATEKTYMFPAGRSLGDYFFYCVVTSERDNGQTANQTSNYVKVRVKKGTRTVSLADREEIVTGDPVSIGEAQVTPEVADETQITYVYYTDEACTMRTTTSRPEAGGSGASEAGGAPSAVGTYYVKAYVAEDEIYEAAENTPPAKLTVKPREHKVDIRVYLDGVKWEEHGRTFGLLGTDNKMITDLDRVLAGEYHVYDITEANQARADSRADGIDTGVRVVVEDQDVWADVHYYTVTFYNEGVPYGEETAQKPQIILSGQQAVKPADPEYLSGYAFEGWMTEPDGNIKYNFSAKVDEKTNLYARWSILESAYQVEHYLQNREGGYTLEETEEFTGTVGEEKIAGAKEYKGYQEDRQNENRIPTGEVWADGSLVLKLYYNAIEYTIDYILDGGQLPEGKSNPTVYTVLSDDIILINPQKAGYAFAGWTETESVQFQMGKEAWQKQVTIPSGSTGNRSYAANWEIQEFPYQVQHYLQDSTGDYTLKETEYLEGTFGEEKTAEAKEYTGYVEDTENEGRVLSGIVNADGSLVLKLYYNLAEYDINYELDGGQLPENKKNPTVYTVLSDDIVLVNPVKAGYVFKGWTESGSDILQENVQIPTGSTGDRSFTANWETTDISYRVEHYLQAYGGGIYALKETEHLEGIIGEEKTAVPKEYVGYVENEQNAGRISSGLITADKPLVLKLYYAPVVYSISYELNGGELPEGQKNPSVYTIQSREITFASPVRAGYVFTGWTEISKSAPKETMTIPAGSTGNRRFLANWTPGTNTPYWVEHYQENPSGDGYSLSDRELLTGVTGADVIAQAKEYTGFTENNRHTGRIDSGTVSARTPLVLRLYYDRETYVLTFIVDTSKADVHGKTVLVLRHGEAVAKPFVIPKPGYKLSEQYDGWDKEVPSNAEATATYTAQISGNGIGKPLEEAEQVITKTDTDKTDIRDSEFYPLMLRAYGKDKSIRLKWHRIKEADGYILYGSKCGLNMKRIRTIKNGKTTSCNVKKLKEGTYYKYLVVAYQNVDGKKQVTHRSKSAHAVTNGGKYGNPSGISCKPASITLKKGKSKTLKPSYKETKEIRIHIAKFRYYSDNPKVASVNKKGKVTGKSAGSCNIYVYAQNGHYKKVKVKVIR